MSHSLERGIESGMSDNLERGIESGNLVFIPLHLVIESGMSDNLERGVDRLFRSA